MTRSLGFATDLAIRVLEGAVLERREGCTVVRTAANPTFRWGNFLLADSVDDGPEAWAAAHRAAFPDAGFVTVGIDSADASLDEQRWTAAGFTVERYPVLVADGPPPLSAVPVRPLVSDEDWAAVLAIEADEAAEPEDPAFSTERLRQRRGLVGAGAAIWLGVEAEGRIVSTLGVVDGGGGLARFQDVQTMTAHRRRGFAGALVAAGAQAAAERFGSTRFVIVAEAEGPAIGLYRRLGFVDAETQVQLERLPGGD